jgi:hypothetical protein
MANVTLRSNTGKQGGYIISGEFPTLVLDKAAQFNRWRLAKSVRVSG